MRRTRHGPSSRGTRRASRGSIATSCRPTTRRASAAARRQRSKPHRSTPSNRRSRRWCRRCSRRPTRWGRRWWKRRTARSTAGSTTSSSTRRRTSRPSSPRRPSSTTRSSRPTCRPAPRRWDQGQTRRVRRLRPLSHACPRLGPETALRVADGWAGDTMITFSDAGQTCLKVRFVGRDAENTKAIGDALDQWAVGVQQAKVTRADKPGITFTTCDTGSPSRHRRTRAMRSSRTSGSATRSTPGSWVRGRRRRRRSAPPTPSP